MILDKQITLDDRRRVNSPRINLFRYGSRLHVHGRKSFRSTRFKTGSLCSMQSSNFFPLRSSSSRGSFERLTNNFTLQSASNILKSLLSRSAHVLAEERFQCRVFRIVVFVVFVMDDDPRGSIGPLLDQIGPAPQPFPTEQHLIGTQ